MTEVSVYERRNPSGERHWQYDFKVTLPDGSIYRERRKARGANTEAAARRIGEARLVTVLRGGPPPRRGLVARDTRRTPTVAEFGAEWLDLCRSERQSPNTVLSKEAMLRLHIVPVLGSCRLDEITEQKITALRKRLADHKASTVNLIVRTLLVMLRRAKRLGYSASVPEVKRLPEQTRRLWYTPEDYEKLVASAATFDALHLAIVLLGGDAGLRAGEIGALRWTDVDFSLRTLSVRNNLVCGVDRAPKWGTARDIPMTRRLQQALLRLRELDGGIGRVLKRSDGGPFITTCLRIRLERVARYAGVPVYGPHALRHSFGTRLMLNGTGAQVAMELLGHTKLQTTQAYVHASKGHRREAIDRLVAE